MRDLKKIAFAAARARRRRSSPRAGTQALEVIAFGGGGKPQDGQIQTRLAVPRRDAPEFLQEPFAPEIRGRRECRVAQCTRSLACDRNKTHDASHTGTPE